MSKMKRWICAVALCSMPFLTASTVENPRVELAEQFGQDSAVLLSYDRLMQALQGKVGDKELDELKAAILFAEKMHHSDKRKADSKIPYLCYPLDVAYELVTVGQVYDAPILVAAILHDTLRKEQKADILSQIKEQFGSTVADTVQELGLYPISAKEKKQKELISHASKEKPAVVEIQLANLLYNLKELKQTPPKGWTKEQKEQYLEFAHSLLDKLPKANASLEKAVEQEALKSKA